MNEAEKHRNELEASASLGETSLWIEALAEEAESREEGSGRTRPLSTGTGS